MGWWARIFARGPGRGGLQVAPGRSFPRAVAGEGAYQDALSDLAGGKQPGGHEIVCAAVLIPEPENPHDANAVRVAIHRRTVGYLSREDAARYVAQLSAAGHGGQPVTVRAKIVGGWRESARDQGDFGVYLDFKWPLKVTAA